MSLNTCSVAEDDVVDWDEDQLDDVSNETHNDDTHETSLKDLGVLGSIWASAFIEKV